jgi:tetratricopeptide (TPR) repeat protein
MRSSIRGLVVSALLAGGFPALLDAQDAVPKDRPKIHVSLHKPSKQDLDHREALKLYGLGMLHERGNRLLEAVSVFEQAKQLDPEAAPVYRALCPLYLALDRIEDGLSACRKAVELDPGDFESWFLLARQYRALDRSKDAIAAFQRARACAGLKERAELRAQICYDLGVLHENAQQYAAAEQAFREVVAVLDNTQALAEVGVLSREEITTQAAETYERLGRVCLKAKRYEAAIEAFQAAQKKDAKRAARLAYNLAEVQQARGNLAEALHSLDVYLQSQPQGTEAYERRITLLESLGRSNEVLPSLQRAADADKFNVGLKLLLAAQYAKRGERQKAEAIYQSLLSSSPSADVYRGLIALYEPKNDADMTKLLQLLDQALTEASNQGEQRGSPARAAEARALLQVLKEDPNRVGGLLSAARRRLTTQQSLGWETRYYLAVLAARTQKLEEAETLYSSCLQGLGGRRHEAEVYSGLLQVLWQGRKHKEIVDICQKGMLNARGTSRVLFEVELARAYLALDKFDQAIEEATHAAEHAADENRLFCRRLKAQVLAQAKRYDEAVQECQDLLKEYKQSKDVREIRYVMSGIYSAAKKSAEAEEQLQLILEQDPNDATANNDLGYLWADEGKNLAEAEKLIRKALELDRAERTKGKAVGPDSEQDNAAYVDSLGWVLFRRGRLAEAKEQLEKAVALPESKDDPVVWDHLGDICMRLNDTARARTVWQKALTLYEEGRRKGDDRYNEIKQKLKLLK